MRAFTAGAFLISCGLSLVCCVPSHAASITLDVKDVTVQENKKGQSLLYTITNTFGERVTITAIKNTAPMFHDGELDDAVTNPGIKSPALPFNLPNGSTANFRLTFDTIDTILDGDDDFGVWFLGAILNYTAQSDPGTTLVASKIGEVTVVDHPVIPLPPAVATGACGLAAVGALACWRKYRILRA